MANPLRSSPLAICRANATEEPTADLDNKTLSLPKQLKERMMRLIRIDFHIFLSKEVVILIFFKKSFFSFLYESNVFCATVK